MTDVRRSPSGLLPRGSRDHMSLPSYLDTTTSPQRLRYSDGDDIGPPRAGPSSLNSPSDMLPSMSRHSPVRHSSNEWLPKVPSPKGSPAPSPTASRINQSPPVSRSVKGFCSQGSVENARYGLKQSPMPDHYNEDRCFSIDSGNYQVFAVFDGHDGRRAVDFSVKQMKEFFSMESWQKVVERENNEEIAMVLCEFFKTTEREFFRSISEQVGFREAVAACIPQELTSYQAQLQYPHEVAQLQMLESEITGGCTAVLAVIANKKLYVANVGDSRAILIRENPKDRTLYCEQLSVDHGVENQEELTRLESLGLNRERLKKAGRLGMQENTRSIGDYYIKQGYKNVDTLESATAAPGIATPYVATPVPVDNSFRYLVLVTDGVYKSIEGMFPEKEAIDANKVLTNMIQNADTPGSNPTRLADAVLNRIVTIHEDTYQKEAAVDPRCTKAVNCRKRDDATCIIYKFPPKATPRSRQPQLPSHLAQQSSSRSLQ